MLATELKLDHPIVLKDGTRGHFAGIFNNGMTYCMFKDGKTSWTVAPPVNSCDNLINIEKDDICVLSEYLEDIKSPSHLGGEGIDYQDQTDISEFFGKNIENCGGNFGEINPESLIKCKPYQKKTISI